MIRERVLGASLTGLLLLATLGEGGGAPGAMALWHGVLVALVASAILFPRARGPVTAAPASALIPFSLFLIVFALGALRSPYAYAAWLQSFELACWVAVTMLAVRLGAGWLQVAVPLLLVAAAGHAGHAIGQWWVSTGVRPAGTFLNPNHMASWLVAVILFATGAAARSPDRRLRVLVWLAVPPVVVAVVLSGSRGGLLALLAGGVWLAARVWREVPRRRRLLIAAGLVLLIAVAGVRQLERLRDFDPFRYQRVKIWRAALGALAADPFWGSGPGQFADAAANLQFPDGDGPLRYDRAFKSTHSDLLRLPVELGAPAAAAGILALVAVSRTVGRRRRRRQLPPGADGAIAALVAIGVQSLVDNPSSWPSVYLLGAAFLGAVSAVPAHAEDRSSARLRVALAGVVVTVFLVGDLAPYLAWRQGNGLPRGELTPERLARLERASELNRLQPHYRLRLAEHLAAVSGPWTLESYAVAREAAEQAIRLNPAAAVFRRGLARVEARACRELRPDVGCRERTRGLYEKAETLARFDPTAPIELAAFLLDTGDPIGARRAAERALTLEPEAALPRLLLADVFIELGAPDSAREMLAEAEGKTARWVGESDGALARRLIAPDPAIRERLEAKIAAAEGGGQERSAVAGGGRTCSESLDSEACTAGK